MKEKLKYAQDLIKTNSPYVSMGFNQFIMGHETPNFNQGYSPEEAGGRIRGYEYAKEMAENGEIYFTHPFKCGDSESCHPFQYGGFFVCNACGNKNVDRDWWKVKVEKDGNSYCCHGIDFKNIQESKNYAFGDSFKEALNNYRKIMLTKAQP